MPFADRIHATVAIAEIAWVYSAYIQWFHKDCSNTDEKHPSQHYPDRNSQMVRKNGLFLSLVFLYSFKFDHLTWISTSLIKPNIFQVNGFQSFSFIQLIG